MDFAGPASTLEISAKDDAILFRVVPHKRWIDLLVPAVIMSGACIVTAPWGLAISILAGLGVCGWWAIRWFGPEEIHSLLVTEYQLVSSRAGTIRWHQIYGVTYGHGGEDDPSGLYTQGAIGGDCLLVLSEEQTLEVITAIYAKFPYLKLKPQPEPGPLAWLADRIPILGGSSSSLTTLGLSNPKDPMA